MSLVDVLNQLETADEEMKKEAAELEKIAAEEEAAGRITARGFMDELNKLAQGMQFKPQMVDPKPLKPLNREPGLPPKSPLPGQTRTSKMLGPEYGKKVKIPVGPKGMK